MRMGCPFATARGEIGKNAGDQRLQLVVLAEEIGFVHRHLVDETLHFLAGGFEAEGREILRNVAQPSLAMRSVMRRSAKYFFCVSNMMPVLR